MTGQKDTAAASLDGLLGRLSSRLDRPIRFCFRRSRARGLVGALRLRDGVRRPGQDRQVETERPVLDVVEVESDAVLPGQVAAAADLPQAGDAGLDEQAALDVGGVFRDLARQRRPRTNE